MLFLKVTEAFNNESLSTLNRVQAIAIRVTTKNSRKHSSSPRGASSVHSLKRVQESFSGELTKGFQTSLWQRRAQAYNRVWLSNKPGHLRRHVNNRSKWGAALAIALIGEGKDTINPLHDSRVAEILCRLDIEQFSVQPLALGQQDEKDNHLKIPQGTAADSRGRIIVGGERDCDVKVYDRFGKFQYSFPCPPSGEPNTVSSITNVATDVSDNAYILIKLEKSMMAYYQVYVFTKQSVSQCFSLKENTFLPIFPETTIKLRGRATTEIKHAMITGPRYRQIDRFTRFDLSSSVSKLCSMDQLPRQLGRCPLLSYF